MDECLHKQTKNNYCINCGIEVEDNLELVDDPIFVPVSRSNNYLQNRYKLHKVYEDKELDRLLEDMNIKEYKYDVIEVIQNKVYKQRLSKLDKVLITIFYVLKNKSYPIIFMDLECYSKNLKKKYYKEFAYNTTEEYIRSVYERFYAKLSDKVSDRYSMFSKVYKEFITYRIERVVLAVLLKDREDLKGLFEEYSLERYVKYELLKNLINKIVYFLENKKKIEKQEECIMKKKKIVCNNKALVPRIRNELEYLGIDCKHIRNINELLFLLRNYIKKDNELRTRKLK